KEMFFLNAQDGTGTNRTVSQRNSSKRVLTGCFLSLLIMTTLLGNTLVCAAVTKFRHLRSKVTNFFVISLAISDLLVAILVMPWKAATEIVGFWPFGAFCDVWVAFDIMCSTASILNLCVISVDRYWAISSPFRYERKMTPKVAFIMISVAWTLSILISFIPVQLNWHKAQATSYTELNGTYGELPPDNCDSSLNRTYAISSSLISFYVFVCCWLPFFVLNCMVPFCNPNESSDFFCISSTTFDVFVWFGWANSSLNPIIYAFNADFRKAFSTLLGCHRLCPGSNAIEIVSINNNGGPPSTSQYQPKGQIPKEGNNSNYVIPHSILCQEEENQKREDDSGIKTFEKLSPSMSGNLDSDADVSLEKINPITQNGQHKSITC
uniref:Dopamine receptor D1b n=1 Tax=Cyprinus carpio TaxID=7962 RepID=A0A8C2FLX6_CYPCA